MVLFRYFIMMLNVIPFLLVHLLTKSTLADLTEDTITPPTKKKCGNPLTKELRYVLTRDETSSVADKITDAVLEEVFSNCSQILKDRKNLIDKLVKEGKVIKHSDRRHDLSLNRAKLADPHIYIREGHQLPFQEVSNLLIKKFNISRSDSNSVLPTISFNAEASKPFADECRGGNPVNNCDPNSLYRTIDGSCNNLQNPTWGSTANCQQRLTPAYYEGQSDFRRSRNGDPLPPPRTLSLNLFYHYNRPTDYVTHMFMFFGQLLDHDIALTPASTAGDNQAIECCPMDDEMNHPQCAPIAIPRDDPFYSQFNQTCMNFVRSAICPTCTLGVRQLATAVTSFIDASFIYGNMPNETSMLRENDGTGRLRSQRTNGEELLPRSSDPQNDQCSFPATNDICFQAGDSRANQHTVLTSLHTLFMREHNRIATELGLINPQWSGDTLFEETRRIMGAIVQVITYKEYLPIVLGKDRMSYFKLWFGHNTKYDPKLDPTMMIEFTTAAFRFGHSMINSVVTNYPRNGTNGRRLLRNEFFQPFDLYEGLAGPLLEGASNSPAQWFDRHVVPDVSNYLYRIRGDRFGMDLGAININRGRDHGVPTYVEMVSYCSKGEIEVRSFWDLVNKNLMNNENMNALRQNYRYVQDVDLFAGILMETPNDGAVVGPTAACVIGMQFYNLKYGDRFYVEHINQVGTFTYQQIQQLKRITLSNVICLNTEVSRIATNAMLFASRNNPMINCRYVRGIDLSYWRE